VGFEMGEEGKLVLSGVLMKGYTSGLLFLFKGVKTGDLDARGPNEPTLETLGKTEVCARTAAHTEALALEVTCAINLYRKASSLGMGRPREMENHLCFTY
jgi:hypothetical protein